MTSYQTYENRGGPHNVKQRVKQLRALLKKQKLDGIIIPRSDPFMNEYISAHDERLLWLTGFSGSNGLAIVMQKKAALFSDGRYRLQAKDQLDHTLFSFEEIPQTSPTAWLKTHLKKNMRLAICDELHGVGYIERTKTACKETGAKLIMLKQHLVDQIWLDQPARPANPITQHPQKYAGKSAKAKLDDLKATLKTKNLDAQMLTACDSIAWLFNLRGSDIAHTPIAFMFAIVHQKKKPELFVDKARLSAPLRKSLQEIVTLHSPEKLDGQLAKVGHAKTRILIAPSSCNGAIARHLKKHGAVITKGADLVQLPKAIKNTKELDGARTAHQRDAIAMCQFLSMLAQTPADQPLTEIDAAKALEQFRRNTGALKDISFETISGAGSNGAIVHYRVSEQSNRPLKQGTLYLVDSGGQYQDGTTDITRTLAIGTPTKPMIRHYTLVLKAHIALSMARFPAGTNGIALDAICRAPLWAAGLDFDHGTGHGVGSFLSVHEGPCSISKRGATVLQPGMILSNEPGYYQEGAYGIRIENLVTVQDLSPIKQGERPMLGFKTLTLVPYDRSLINPSFLSKEELSWLNAYHKRVWKMISPSLKGADKAWLKKATKALTLSN